MHEFTSPPKPRRQLATYRRCTLYGCMRKRADNSAFCSIHCDADPPLPSGSDRNLIEKWCKEDLVMHCNRCRHCKDIRPLKVVWNWNTSDWTSFLALSCIEGKRLAQKWLEFTHQDHADSL